MPPILSMNGTGEPIKTCKLIPTVAIVATAIVRAYSAAFRSVTDTIKARLKRVTDSRSDGLLCQQEPWISCRFAYNQYEQIHLVRMAMHHIDVMAHQ
jgi:hypothetical protein